jgi:YihY family inner membrane protein
MAACRRRRLPVVVLYNVGRAAREFYRENGIDKASILAYYSIFCSFFLLLFFSLVAGRLMVKSAPDIGNMYPFTPEFIERIVPGFFRRAAMLARQIGDLGPASIAISLFMGGLIFRKVIQYVNEMFHITVRKGFFLRRLEEFGLLVVVTLLTAVSVVSTTFIQLVSALVAARQRRVSPALLGVVDSILISYLVPFLITCLLFFLLYKWIPEEQINTRSALSSAVICAVLWEGGKRCYAYYLVHFSMIGRMQDSVISIILFGFWMEINMGVMLFGAKLTYLFDREESCCI